MGCTLCFNKQEMTSFYNSFDENKSDFRYSNENAFLGIFINSNKIGYPKYRNLQFQLAQILNTQKQTWTQYYSELMEHKRLISQYQCFIQAASQYLTELISKEATPQEIMNQFQIRLTADFNTNLKHQIILEIQDIQLTKLLTKSHRQYFIRISFNFTQKVYESEMKQLDEGIHFDWVIQQELEDCYIEDTFQTVGDLKTPKDYLVDKIVSMQLVYRTGNLEHNVGETVSFNLIEIQDQRIYEKSVKIVKKSRMIANVTMRFKNEIKIKIRFQIVFNLQSFLKFWKMELSERDTQIQRMLDKIQEFKQSHDQAGSEHSGRFSSLLSNDDKGKNDSVYDLPFSVK